MHIHELRLTTTMLAPQQQFYAEVLGLPLLNTTAGRATFQAGASRLAWESVAEQAGVYHFAFNIPPQQWAAATQWARTRLTLLSDADGVDTFYSTGWDAHMLYFHDPAGNIVELIARQRVPHGDNTAFDPSQIINISEIGVAAEDVQGTAAQLMADSGAPCYDGADSATFTALGDEQGLLIVVQCGRRWYPELCQPAVALPLTVVAQHQGGAALTVRF